MKYVLIALVLCNSFFAKAQKKKWYDDYWLSTQVNLIYGSENTLGFSTNAGKDISKNLCVGLGYSGTALNTGVKLSTFELLGEISKREKGRQLFVQVKPGINVIRKAEEFGNSNSFYEYEKSKIGTNLYAGAGMRWFVGRHAFSLSVGVMDSRYSFTAKEYPVPVDPFNPFAEDPLQHKYSYKHQKVVISLGFRF